MNEEKNRLIAAGNDYNFVTNVDEILNDDEIQIVVELMGRIEPARTFITKALEAGKKRCFCQQRLDCYSRQRVDFSCPR